MLDDDLSRRFTPDMRKAEEAGALERALLLPDLLTGRAKLPDDPRAVLIRLTGTPMQNLAVIDLMRAGQGRADG